MNGNNTILTIEIRSEHDIVLARQRARQIACLLKFDRQSQTSLATAVSEIARNAYAYGGGGRVEFLVTTETEPFLSVRVSDRGRGIARLNDILNNEYCSTTGMGLGIAGARRLMDRFQIDSTPGAGTVVEMGLRLPWAALPFTAGELGRVTAELARIAPDSPLQEVQLQNQELIRALDELRLKQEQLEAHQEKLLKLNRELEDTNRGIIALYSELDEKALTLQRASEVKSRFISNMSHEFRTPLNSIMTLSQLMLDQVDGKLSPEHERQATYIRKAAQSLSDLVNDLLDLAKIEAGKTVVHAANFSVADLFSSLRGMLRPLVGEKPGLNLVFDAPEDLPEASTDESKVSQILRNLISNAIKFTERGEVRISAWPGPEEQVLFTVSDTGIGIAPEDQERIFQEYAQVEGPQQKHVKGTGLGLPLAKRLAEMLGGGISLKSAPGQGSTFTATIPRVYHGPAEIVTLPEFKRDVDPARMPVLVVEDSLETVFLYDKYLKNTSFQVIPARTLDEARQMLKQFRPQAIILDILMESEYAWNFLAELKQNKTTRDIPVFVATVVDNQPKALALGAEDFSIKPIERKWLLDHLKALPRREPAKVLIIDDDEISRYLLKGFLAGTDYKIIEAQDGDEGLWRAREERPMVIFLDLVMPEVDGFTVLERLKADPQTREIPVIVHSSKAITEVDYARLGDKPVAILSKQVVSRDAALENIRQALAKAGVTPTFNQ